MTKIRVGVAGFGNVGRGVLKAVTAFEDMEPAGVFTRRDPAAIELIDKSVPVYTIKQAADMKDLVDVMVLCGGSAGDLAEQGPQMASIFNTVDSYDTHAKIPVYMASINAAATKTTAIISAGWDPGLFSMIRAFSEAILPGGSTYTFWGKGVSQGHSDAIKRLGGVKHAIQYTVPVDSAVEAARSGQRPVLTARQKHLRECYVVAQQGADQSAIEREIKTMPDYFADYDTTVHFIEEPEFMSAHMEMPHGGMVLHSGDTGGNAQSIEFSLKLASNPEFTGSIMAAYARAAYRLAAQGQFGAKTVLDVPLSYLSPEPREEVIKRLL
ncbi:MAG: diaminopimelate dehydrogenase [Oscillospiraceae bacterium]|nr:diaminopimelate dehydrogenase [Oscillospiraceae bacterium]